MVTQHFYVILQNKKGHTYEKTFNLSNTSKNTTISDVQESQNKYLLVINKRNRAENTV